jgi:hypothetical protein
MQLLCLIGARIGVQPDLRLGVRWRLSVIGDEANCATQSEAVALER